MIVDAHVHLFPDRLAEAIRRWFSDHAWEIRYRIGVTEAVRTLRVCGALSRGIRTPFASCPISAGTSRPSSKRCSTSSSTSISTPPWRSRAGSRGGLTRKCCAGARTASSTERTFPTFLTSGRASWTWFAPCASRLPTRPACSEAPPRGSSASREYRIFAIDHSVSRDRRIDELRPGIDTAPERDRVLESRRPEDERGVQAAHAVVAVAHDEPLLFRLDLRGAPG